jgi:glutathione S-transferase
MSTRTLVIGNRNYSSWSLRAYLALSHLGIGFETLRIPLDTPEFHARIGAYSPSARVPVLIEGELRIHDSLAIAEYGAELAGRGWPATRAERACARALAAEMHSGFAALRAAMPMNLRATRRRIARDPALEADIVRIDGIFGAALGPWLFGDYGVVDAMYGPVACRFASYGEEGLGERARAYVACALADPALGAWRALALEECEVIAHDEAGEPAP